MGIYGYKPHKAKDVFHLKYGDCKDKATLLLGMLKSAGIKGYLALIRMAISGWILPPKFVPLEIYLLPTREKLP